MKISIYLFVVAQSSVLLVAATRRKQQKRECASPGNCGEEHLVTSRVDEHFLAADHPTCPPCAKIHCPVKRVRKLKCKGGLTVGVCNCCKTCAKVEGEECGGRHGYLGKCDVGLRCVLHSNSLDATSLPSIVISGDERRGRCVREAPSHDEPMECKRECTADYCLANPKAICSARNTAVEMQDCQGDCQHTSCSACFFREEPPCPKCRKDDYGCIKRFARCAKKKSMCSRNKYPCSKRVRKPQTGKFLCWVPKCL